MTTLIRPIEPKDDPQIAALIRKVLTEFKRNQPGTVFTDPTTDQLYNLFRASGSSYWIASDDDQVLGGCGIYPTEGLPEGYGELVKFYLDPAARGLGLGKLLLEKSFEAAKDSGFKHLYLESFPEFSTAIALYERYGFRHINAALGNSGHFACNVWMVKDL
jgi:putative acetyltransferase